MKTTERFEKAVTKLYNAFHKGELYAWDCKHCAVGNICNNDSSWGYLSYGGVYAFKNQPKDLPIKENFPNKEVNRAILNTGYSSYELAMVETLFVREFNNNTKEEQFKGLCAVVEYLCELDGIPNVMDYTCLFETENNEPKHQLTF